MPNFGLPEIIIIGIVLIVLFGGAKLAGLGKSTGRALREFKEETKGLRDSDKADEQDESVQKDADGGAPSKDDVTRELTRGPEDATDVESRRADEPHRDA